MLLVERLTQLLPTAKMQTLRRLVEARRVLINGQPALRLKQEITQSDAVRIARHRASDADPSPRLPFAIVHEDQDVLVIDKPAGLLTSTTALEKRSTALAAARNYAALDRRVKIGLVHRLDRDASGLLVFSKNAAALASLKRQFFHHTVERVYMAIVSPPIKPASGRIDSLLVEHADGTVHLTRSAQRGARAVTDYATVKSEGSWALLRVTLQTGRKHQIRAHLAGRGAPIIGDRLYGGAPHPAGLLLAAVELSFEHPRTAERRTFQLPLPPRLRNFLKRPRL